MHNLQQLTDRIAKLNSVQQEAVANFVAELENSHTKQPMTLDEAVDEFEHEHPELLRLLAQ